MLLPGRTDFPELLRDRQVRLVASLPHYDEQEVDMQRGAGVFRQSIRVLRRLNQLGYGIEPGLEIDLVHNPGNGRLSDSQTYLQERYASVLEQEHKVSFSRVLAITNMPVGRFRKVLSSDGQDACYMKLLRGSFNPSLLGSLMCRRQIAIRWDGIVFDCDFNLALGLPVNHGASARLEELDPQVLAGRRIVTGSHCFGCTAGRGSSCHGVLMTDCEA
jgi:radical SAM/Cys-rich protein